MSWVIVMIWTFVNTIQVSNNWQFIAVPKQIKTVRVTHSTNQGSTVGRFKGEIAQAFSIESPEILNPVYCRFRRESQIIEVPTNRDDRYIGIRQFSRMPYSLRWIIRIDGSTDSIGFYG